ncbi:MAG: hypothetical protein V1872_09810 [bacterium]
MKKNRIFLISLATIISLFFFVGMMNNLAEGQDDSFGCTSFKTDYSKNDMLGGSISIFLSCNYQTDQYTITDPPDNGELTDESSNFSFFQSMGILIYEPYFSRTSDTDSFTFTITNSNGETTDSQMIRIDLTGIPGGTHNECTSDKTTYSKSDLIYHSGLDKDVIEILNCSDYINSTLRITEEPTHGELFNDFENTGTVLYIPTDTNGIDSFTFEITIIIGMTTNPTTITIDLTGTDTVTPPVTTPPVTTPPGTGTPPQILEVHPVNLEKDAEGNIISDPVATNASFAVLLSDKSGIDTTTTGENITFTISYTSEAGSKEYNHSLGDDCMSVIDKEGQGSEPAKLKKFWIRYDKSKDQANSSLYPFDREITVTVNVINIDGKTIEPAPVYKFKTISEEILLTNLIEPKVINNNQTRLYQIHNDQTLIGEIEIAATEGVELEFIKGDQMPSYSRLKDDLGDVLVGEPIYVLTPLVLTEPATLRLYPGTTNNIGGLGIYYTNGLEWVLACNTDGVVQAKASNWMLSGSRLNHNDEQSIEIKVNHFSGIWLGEGNKIPGDTSDPGDPAGSYSSANTSGGEEDDSGMCFIKTINF